MNLALDGLWALAPAHHLALRQIADALRDGARCSGWELEALLGVGEGVGPLRREASVAVVPLIGVLSAAPLFNTRWGVLPRFTAQMREAGNNPRVEAILLEVDSPGGTVAHTQEAARLVREIRKRKKVFASVNTLAGSAALWIASQANEIAVTPSGLIGSLGVIAHHSDASGALEREGVTPTVIARPAGKHDESGVHPLSAEGLKNLQRLVDHAYGEFLRDVSKGRSVSQTFAAERFGQGRLLTARAAVAARLADRVETFSATLDRLTGRKPAKLQLSEQARAAQSRLAAEGAIAHIDSVGQAQDERLEPKLREWEERYDPRRRLAQIEALEAEWQ